MSRVFLKKISREINLLKGADIQIRHIRKEDLEYIVRLYNEKDATYFLMDPLRKRNLLTLEQSCLLWEAGMFSIEYIIETLKGNFEGMVRLYPYFNGVRLDMYGEKREYLLKAGHMIIEDCFNKQISRIETQLIENDRFTFQIFKQLNFYQEGILKEMIFYNDNYMDVYLLALLQEEYERNNSR